MSLTYLITGPSDMQSSPYLSVVSHGMFDFFSHNVYCHSDIFFVLFITYILHPHLQTHTVRFPGQQEESPNASVYIIKLDHQSLMIWEKRTKMTNMLHNHYLELIRIFSENRDKESSMNIV